MANQHKFVSAWSPLGATLVALLLAGCERNSTPVDAAPASSEAPAAPAEASPADAVPPGSEVPPPDAAEPAPSPPPNPPSPAEPSATPTPTSAEGPALGAMSAAKASAKLSVPVDLRYSFEAASQAGQPMTLHLAAIPRSPGTRLRVSVKQAPGIHLAGSPPQVEKATASGVYRQTLAVTRTETGPDSLRVLVTMDLAAGNGFGYFTIPLSGSSSTQKVESVKQR